MASGATAGRLAPAGLLFASSPLPRSHAPWRTSRERSWQELVFIGMDLPELEITAALDRCLLDDAEMDALRTSEAST